MIRLAAAILVMLALLVPSEGANSKTKPTTAKPPVRKTASGAPSAKKPVKAARKRTLSRKRVATRKLRVKTAVRHKKRRVPSKVVRTRFVVQEPAVTGLQCAMGETAPGEAMACVSCSEQALVRAHALVGLRYRRGGTSVETGFDCSGFVQHVFGTSCQLKVPRSASEQYRVGLQVERDDLRRGDLVFFKSRRGWHVGIYTGDGNFIHSPNRRDSVKVSSLDAAYYRRTYLGARRIAHDITGQLPDEPPVYSPDLSVEAEVIESGAELAPSESNR